MGRDSIRRIWRIKILRIIKNEKGDKMDIEKYEEARNTIVKILRKELIGPVDEKEIIEGNRPDESYCLGILYPQGQVNSEDEDLIVLQLHPDESKETREYSDSEQQDDGVKIQNVEKQSSMGISFNVKVEQKELNLFLKYAQYNKIKVDKEQDDKEKEEKKNYHGERWQRTPKSVEIKVNIEESTKIEIEEGLQIKIYINKIFTDGTKTVTVTVINTNVESDRRNLSKICQKAFFQIELQLEIEGKGEFIEKKIDGKYTNDYEIKNLDLLYRDNKNIAIGHGCSAMWDYESKFVNKIWIDQIPMYKAKQMVPNQEDEMDNQKSDNKVDNFRKMNYLYTAGKEDVCKELNKFILSYEKWLEKQKNQENLTENEIEILNININKANVICDRMKHTITLLSEDEMAYKSFQLMNLAMMKQMMQKQHKEKEDCSWFTFQIAFILLSIDGIIDPSDENRQIVDLLWFPTGGGKTEAYLGVIAFTIFLRRMREVKEGRSGAGVTAIMRYTLRLLTLQQFQRASTLICACELIRRDNINLLGTEEISIGLWVGELTKNKLDDQKKQIRNFIESQGKTRENDPCLIKECPWCKERIKPIQYNITPVDRIEIKCGKCEFEGALPIYIVDDEVYTHRPTLLFSTIDKYARIPWEARVRKLFGIDDDEILPPELIIQDELHLIAGPLGTIDGLYEIILDELFRKNNIKPKIIASTATIRNSDSQIKALYNRNNCIFPTQIRNIKNSFFAREGSETEKASRLYLGVISNNVTQTTLLIRVYSALFYAVKYIEQSGKYDEEIVDSFWTLVGYFNSIKELGGAVVQIRNDVDGRYKYLVNNKFVSIMENEQEKMRAYFSRYEELTSRNANNARIGEILKNIENKHLINGNEGNPAYNYILATNMISVGIDIDRLNLMIINGQPKLNAEYIQASSRVGRKTPSIVITMYNSSKSRDISHYEQFIRYHSNIYKYVEATSVTPFANMAREKAMHSIIISLARQLIEEMNSNEGAALVSKYSEQINEFKDIILKRAEDIAPEKKAEVEKELDRIIEKWESISSGLGYVKNEKKNINKELLVNIEEEATKSTGFKTLNSMRNVDTASNIYVKDNE